MATNVEIKAQIRNWEQTQQIAVSLSDAPCRVIPQRDIFFHTPRGRLKLRVLAPERGQLIYYERSDATGPRESNYMISETAHPDSLEQVLSVALGVRGVVRKTRYLYMVGHTRVHLDQVEGLGSFLELETVLEPGQTVEQGQQIVSQLMAKLGVRGTELIDVAYVDLIERIGDDHE